MVHFKGFINVKVTAAFYLSQSLWEVEHVFLEVLQLFTTEFLNRNLPLMLQDSIKQKGKENKFTS